MSYTSEKPPRNLSYTDCRKIHCGLRWDPETEADSKIADLDLLYALFDEYGRCMGVVSGKDGIRTDDSGSIYHSGDDADGAEDGDDERITLDLFSIPKRIHYVFLVSEISSHHQYGSVKNPMIRIVRAAENQELVKVNLRTDDGVTSKAHIFMRLDRLPGGWNLNTVDRYTPGTDLPNWEELLMEYLPALASEKRENANLPPSPRKGETVPLFYSKEGRQRVICGLSWDLREGKLADQVDADLSCLMFDDQAEYVDDVSTDSASAIDASGAVYHSGDEITGRGGGDDEIVSVELAKLPPYVSYLVFLVDMKTDHRLKDIRNPMIRIADGKTDMTQLEVRIDQNNTDNAFIFAYLMRSGTEWKLHHIGQPLDTATVINDWTEPIVPHLKAAQGS